MGTGIITVRDGDYMPHAGMGTLCLKYPSGEIWIRGNYSWSQIELDTKIPEGMVDMTSDQTIDGNKNFVQAIKADGGVKFGNVNVGEVEGNLLIGSAGWGYEFNSSGTPYNNFDVVNKKYVDDVVGGIIPPIDTSQFVITHGDQDIAGVKTFTNQIEADAGIKFGNANMGELPGGGIGFVSAGYVYELNTSGSPTENYDIATKKYVDDNAAAGVPGPQGPQGLQGEPGIQGMSGVDGSNGIDGLPGSDGIDGVPGIQGIDGPVGADGIQGIQGIQGAPGQDGLPGADSTIPGPQGVPGADGTVGAQGPQGEDGAQGIPGIPGDVLPQDQKDALNFAARPLNNNNPVMDSKTYMIHTSDATAHLTAGQHYALEGANAPSGVNVLATMADLIPGIQGEIGLTGPQGEPGTPADISTFVQKSGDTMTGDLSGIDPTMPQHLATKAYVDSKISPTLGGKWEYVEDDLTPGTGKFGSDTTSLAAASMLYFAGEDLNGVDFTNFLPLLKVGNTVYIQDANESTKYAAFLMNASPINNDGVVEVSVTYEAGGEIVEDGDKSSVLFFIAGQDAQPPSEEGPHRVPIIEVDIAGMMPSKALCQVAMQDLGLDVNTNVMFFIIDTFGFIKPSYMIHYYKDNQEFYIAMMPKAV